MVVFVAGGGSKYYTYYYPWQTLFIEYLLNSSTEHKPGYML